jgi:aspartyl-tRNA(Asn)/glutamyl-tRNA(Gln) amidotransferase subunit C
MSLSADDIERLARLSRLGLTAPERDHAATDLNNIFAMVAALQAVDTTGVEPLSHPLATIRAMSLGLRADAVTAHDGIDGREANMANAPEREDGLFLVPKVIE